MITIDKSDDGKLFFITLVDADGIEQELNLTKDEMSELYGAIGMEMSKIYMNDLDKFFKKSRENIMNDDQKILCDAIANQEIPAPKVDEVKIIKNTGPIHIKM